MFFPKLYPNDYIEKTMTFGKVIDLNLQKLSKKKIL